MITGTSLALKHNTHSQLEIHKPAHWILRGHICSLLCRVEPFSCIQVLAHKICRRKHLPLLFLFPTTLFSVTSRPFRWGQEYSICRRTSLALTSPILTGKGLEKAPNRMRPNPQSWVLRPSAGEEFQPLLFHRDKSPNSGGNGRHKDLSQGNKVVKRVCGKTV